MTNYEMVKMSSRVIWMDSDIMRRLYELMELEGSVSESQVIAEAIEHLYKEKIPDGEYTVKVLTDTKLKEK